ncbi:hypothetical protein ABZX40_12765 [Streptomyces sp. NPDC004610]|uniref:hypothetical protein n=1 Tax=unclassified Streptomyces TaxID=2593676 RepID=UPI0033B9BF9E
MQTALPTDRERAALQAYLRLLHTVRAACDMDAGPPGTGRPPLVPPAVLAEADRALAEAGLSGNEEALFRMLGRWCPPSGGSRA